MQYHRWIIFPSRPQIAQVAMAYQASLRASMFTDWTSDHGEKPNAWSINQVNEMNKDRKTRPVELRLDKDPSC